jgi:SPP1 gp7 family putative phage head morphogenesis protein
VREVYKQFPDWRAELIARTEATAANNAGFQDAYQQSGVANAKEWIATKDARTRDEHIALDGEVVALGSTFSNGIEFPSEPNCRCVLGPAFIERR